jgi:predicted dehydrogenase
MARIGIIGAGFMGTAHSAAILKSTKHTLVGIADIDRSKGEALAKDRACKYFSTAEELLAQPDIDIVHICLPTNLHCAYIQKSAAAGKHVLCEKPFSLHDSEIAAAIDATKANNVKLMIAQVVRFWPENVVIKQYKESGVLGEIKMCSAHRLGQIPAWADWYRKPEISGGGLFDLHTHDIDNMIDLFGTCTEVYSIGAKRDGCWNYMSTSLTFSSGKKSLVESSLNMPGDYPFSTSFRLLGERACIEQTMRAGANLDDMSNSVRTLKFYEDTKPCVNVPYEAYDAYWCEIEHFADCVDQGVAPRISPEESRNVMRVIRAIEASLSSGKTVPTGWVD